MTLAAGSGTSAGLSVRRADRGDLEALIRFARAEAREAEGLQKAPETLRAGIEAALEDERLALYWVLLDEHGRPVGNVSALAEWSDWNAGYYWWVQSLYVAGEHRGTGAVDVLLDAVRAEVRRRGGLDLRLYVHADNERARRAYRRMGFAELPYRIMKLEL